ncbi:GNAT family N-acetyltransferase [Methylobacterium sp. J-077]|uniref:GNAT family N-acetyltransferase n=1 Tax=Methylobacterium sp. J-077 TaxID=2836656 RepID=UPI001FB94A0F|nr:GNAT family N-acetyltransferase [Methylobacterium sp. J-077]MCJ2121788.1 GNAT family N-acetyltransferase [Methylobacterium sp. J-077]
MFHDHDTGTLRLATKDDVFAIRALTRAAYAKWVPIIGREPVPMTADYASAIHTHRFDLLERADVLIALIETVLHPDHLWIENLAVSPDHHGQGLGRQMLHQAEHVARSCGREEIKLLTNRAFSGNVAFYGRAGFVVEREEQFKGGIIAYLRKPL